MAADGSPSEMDIDEDLHSCQLAVYGRETNRHLRGANFLISNFLISGLQGLGAEIDSKRVLDCAAKQSICGVISQVSSMPSSAKEECVDLLDLPQPGDEETCVYDEDDTDTNVDWDYGEEEEKACSDRVINSIKTTHRFSRVYEIDTESGQILIPKKYKAVQGSPSAEVKRFPFALSEAVGSTRRLRITFMDDKIKCEKMVYGTAFKVSKKMACSVRHCFQQEGLRLVGAEMCKGYNVSSRKFDSAGCVCQLKEVSANHWSKTKDKDGLFNEGGDVAFFTSTDKSMPFLVPCSPSFLSVAQEKKISILSYPAVHKMLQKAKEELSQSGSTPTWKVYLPAMAKDLQEAIQKFRGSKGARTNKELPKAVLSQLKKTLLEDLEETFAGFSTGSLLCAVGSLVSWNNISLGSTCSTLRGSSGAAICVIGLPGYFIGVHSGGICGHDMNCATSTDNPEFVQIYMTHVLPTLPGVSSSYWESIDTKAFMHWLELHAGQIPQGSPWGERAMGKRTRG